MLEIEDNEGDDDVDVDDKDVYSEKGSTRRLPLNGSFR